MGAPKFVLAYLGQFRKKIGGGGGSLLPSRIAVRGRLLLLAYLFICFWSSISLPLCES